MTDQQERGERFEGTIDSISIYKVSPFNLGSMIKYKPCPGTIGEWEYKLKQGERICDRTNTTRSKNNHDRPTGAYQTVNSFSHLRVV